MKIWLWRAAAALVFSLFLSLAAGQDPSDPQDSPKRPPDPPAPRYTPPPVPGGRGRGGRGFPSATARRDQLLREDRRDNLKDAAQLALLSAKLKRDLENGSSLVLSIDTVKDTDEIGKLAKRIHDRLVHN